MSRTHKDGRNYSKKERHISVRAVRRDPPDLRKMARAIAAVAIAQAEAEAQAKVDAMDAAPAQDADFKAPEPDGSPTTHPRTKGTPHD